MGKIAKLHPDLANQIAAGEVVERPASVVKELVENALDAGATRVRVEIEEGGARLLRVSDDGEGMSADDAALALERHATSKLSRFDDLTTIATFGFRGEALPSIGSVARLTLATRTADASAGIEVIIEGGGPPKTRPTGCAKGTIVEVRDLFFNVPARRKFLKATATESANIGEVLLLAALSRPEVAFALVRDKRVARDYLRATNREERVRAALGEPRLERCEGSRGGVHVEAYLTPPERARSGAVALYLLVNGRPVRDRSLARAVAQAYGSVLEPGRYPIGAVYIDLRPELVDVNVHPQKSEVRFVDARGVQNIVTRELGLGLARAFTLPSSVPSGLPLVGPAGAFLPKKRPSDAPSDGWEFIEQRSTQPAMPLPSFEYDRKAISPPVPIAEPPAAGDAYGAFGFVLPEELRDSLPSPAGPAASFEQLAEPTTQPSARASATLLAQVGFYGRLRFLAQLRTMFLLCEGDDALYVLDQHAAAERVTFHRLRRAFDARTVASQGLLVAEVVELAAAEIAAIEEHSEAIAALGVELRPVSDGAVAVHAVPQVLRRAAPERIVRDLAAELGRLGKRPFGDAVDRVFATMACHGSLRGGDSASREEAEALLRALDDVDFSGHCPHGRPVVTRIPFDELERRVGRP